MTNRLDDVWRAYEEILDQPAGTPNPRVEELTNWEFSPDEVKDLRDLLEVNELRDARYLDDIPADRVKEYLQESIHSNWEGFRDEHKVGLALMIRDLMIYDKHARMDEEIAGAGSEVIDSTDR